MIFWIFFCDTHTHAHKEMNFINISTLSPGHRDALTLVSLKAFSLMTSLFMWAGSEAEGGRAVKVKKVKGEEAGVLQNLTHTRISRMENTHTHANGSTMWTGRHASLRVHTHTRKLQSKFLQPDITLLSIWLRGREAQIKRERRKGREGREGWSSSSSIYLLVVCSLLYTKRALNHGLDLWCSCLICA